MNVTPSEPVYLCFQDRTISLLLADLIASCGATPRIVQSAADLALATLVVTEALALPALSPTQRARCLVVTNAAQPALNVAHQLVRPLTEAKIETALAAFLGSSHPASNG